MPETLSESAETTQRNVTLVNAPRTGLKPAYDVSWALVIGVDNYRHLPRLKYAVGDAVGMATLLVERLGFRRDKVSARHWRYVS